MQKVFHCKSCRVLKRNHVTNQEHLLKKSNLPIIPHIYTLEVGPKKSWRCGLSTCSLGKSSFGSFICLKFQWNYGDRPSQRIQFQLLFKFSRLLKGSTALFSPGKIAFGMRESVVFVLGNFLKSHPDFEKDKSSFKITSSPWQIDWFFSYVQILFIINPCPTKATEIGHILPWPLHYLLVWSWLRPLYYMSLSKLAIINENWSIAETTSWRLFR